MLRFISRLTASVLLSIGLLPAQAHHEYAKDGKHCDSSMKHTLVICPAEHLQEDEAKLDQATEALIAYLQTDNDDFTPDAKNMGTQIREANESWKAMRDKECDWRSKVFVGDGGAFAFQRRLGCQQEMTQARLKQIEAGGLYGPGWETRYSTRNSIGFCGQKQTKNADGGRYFSNCVLTVKNGLEVLMKFSESSVTDKDLLTLEWARMPIESHEIELGLFGRPKKSDDGPQYAWNLVNQDLDGDGAVELAIPTHVAENGEMNIALLSVNGASMHQIGQLSSERPITRILAPNAKRKLTVITTHTRTPQSLDMHLHALENSRLQKDVLIIRETGDGAGPCLIVKSDAASAQDLIDTIKARTPKLLPDTNCP